MRRLITERKMADINQDNNNNNDALAPQDEDEASQQSQQRRDAPAGENLEEIAAAFENYSEEAQAVAVRQARELLVRLEGLQMARQTANMMAGGANDGNRTTASASGTRLQGSGGSRSGQMAGRVSSTPAVTAQSSMFDTTHLVSDEDIAKEAYHLSKDKREPEGTKLGNIQMENATTGLDVKFDVMAHQSSTYSGGGESKRSAYQSVSKQLTSIVQLASMIWLISVSTLNLLQRLVMIHTFGGIIVVVKPVIYGLAGKQFLETLPSGGNILSTGVAQMQIDRVVVG